MVPLATIVSTDGNPTSGYSLRVRSFLRVILIVEIELPPSLFTGSSATPGKSAENNEKV